MKIIFSTPDEREIIRRLCDDLATKHAPLYKRAHLLLKGATVVPIRESDALAACRFAEEVFRVTPGVNVRRELEALARLRAVIQANPNAGIKPTYPNGRFASKEIGGV